MPLSASLPFLATFLEVLRPSRSPHLIATSFGVVILCLASNDYHIIEEDIRFLCIAIPTVLTLIAVVGFSFSDGNIKTIANATKEDVLEDIENQFKFARSMGIASSLLGAVLAGYLVNDSDTFSFFVAWTASAVQLLTFISYSAIRLKKEEIVSELRIFEISFIMFVMLIGFIYCLSEAGDPNLFSQKAGSDETAMGVEMEVQSDSIEESQVGPVEFISYKMRFAVSATVLFLLWLRYEIFWVRRMLRIVEIRVR